MSTVWESTSGEKQPKTFEEAIDVIHAENKRIMIERNRRYGKSNIGDFGVPGVVVRANDKMARLKTMVMAPLLKGESPKLEKDGINESVDDSFVDLSNYGVIGLMVRRGWWGLPREDEVLGVK